MRSIYVGWWNLELGIALYYIDGRGQLVATCCVAHGSHIATCVKVETAQNCRHNYFKDTKIRLNGQKHCSVTFPHRAAILDCKLMVPEPPLRLGDKILPSVDVSADVTANSGCAVRLKRLFFS